MYPSIALDHQQRLAIGIDLTAFRNRSYFLVDLLRAAILKIPGPQISTKSIFPFEVASSKLNKVSLRR